MQSCLFLNCICQEILHRCTDRSEERRVVTNFLFYLMWMIVYIWYTYEALGKWFVVALGNRFHVSFLVYAQWFMSIIISQMKDHYISVDQARYYNSIVAKYLDTATVKTSTHFYKTTLSSDMIFTKYDTSTSA